MVFNDKFVERAKAMRMNVGTGKLRKIGMESVANTVINRHTFFKIHASL